MTAVDVQPYLDKIAESIKANGHFQGSGPRYYRKSVAAGGPEQPCCLLANPVMHSGGTSYMLRQTIRDEISKRIGGDGTLHDITKFNDTRETDEVLAVLAPR